MSAINILPTRAAPTNKQGTSTGEIRFNVFVQFSFHRILYLHVYIALEIN